MNFSLFLIFQYFSIFFICISTGGLADVYLDKLQAYNKTTADFFNSEIIMEANTTAINSLHLLNPIDENSVGQLILNIMYRSDSSHPFVNNQSYIGYYIVEPIPNILVDFNDTDFVAFNITAKKVGSIYLGINSSNLHYDALQTTFCHVQVVHSHILVLLGTIIGWCYFAAWTVSFYPQVILNIQKKSVVGFNFDFVIYNWIGFFSYSAFNVGMLWVPQIQTLYKKVNPIGVIPVQLNDVIFSLHAIIIVTVQLIQCCIYERKGQIVSKFCRGLASCMVIYIIIIASVAGAGVRTFTWLDFLYYLSYLKLFITLIKYIPQAVMNYRRKSTVGWSIGNIFLDFTGGLLSIVQMFILSHNNDDWNGFFADPTKFGLGLFSIMFDIIFLVQHYILYRHARLVQYEVLGDQELPS